MPIKEKKEINTFLIGIFHSLRPSQWIKNLAVFAAIIFNGKLFDGEIFFKSALAFSVFCLFSSASYLINDTIDAPYDRLHPVKKNRPIARGDISTKEARIVAIALLLFGLMIASFLGPGFILLILVFFALHATYSFYLKKVAVLDILGISFSFILRAFGGEVASGYHLPVWLMFTVVFLSLFIASGKRRSELVFEGRKTRPALVSYQKALLNFYTAVFAVSTLVSYSLFSYLSPPPDFAYPPLREFFTENIPFLIDRKWLMMTIFPVIFGIMRYSQFIFGNQEGERPEKILTSDIPLLSIIFGWGLMIVMIIYVF